MSDVYQPDVAAQLPAGGNPNAPESGTYGAGAALERLEASLPGTDPSQPQAMAPVPSSSGGRPQPQAPAGLPPGLSAPTRQPNIPVSTPLAQPQVLVGNGPERRIALAESLVANPDVSQDTKEWAQLYLTWARR